MSQKSDAINFLASQPQWAELIQLEKGLREDFILRSLSVPIKDSTHDKEVCYYKGAIHAIQKLWDMRESIRKEKGKSENQNNHDESDE